MDHAEAVVAVADRVDDQPHGVDVVDLLEGLALHIHFAVNAVDGFDTPLDGGVLYHGFDPRGDLFLDAFQKLLALGLLFRQRPLDLLVGDGIQVRDGQVLQLLFHGPDT